MVQIVVAFILGWSAGAQTEAGLEADLKKHPDHIKVRCQLATNYLREKRFDQVLELLNSYTDQMPSDGFLALASAYSSKHDYTNEVRVLNLLTSKDPNNFRWHMLLAQAHLKYANSAKPGGDPHPKQEASTQAVQQLRQTLQLQPRYKPAFDLLLNTLLQQKAHNEAREMLIEGISNFGNRPELLREICRLDAMDGFLDQAVKNCEVAIKVAPEYPDNYVFLVEALSDQKEDQVAEDRAVMAAKKFPASEFVQWAAGTVFFKKKNFPVSTRYFQVATTIMPTSGRAHFGLAQSLFETGHEAASLDHFVAACAADPSTVDTFLASGGRLKQKGQTALGEKFIQKASTCHK